MEQKICKHFQCQYFYLPSQKHSTSVVPLSLSLCSSGRSAGYTDLQRYKGKDKYEHATLT